MDLSALSSLFGGADIKSLLGLKPLPEAIKSGGILGLLSQSMNAPMEESKGPNSVEEAGGLQPLSLPPDPARRELSAGLGKGLQGMGGQMMKQGAAQMAQPMKPPAATPGSVAPFQPMASSYQAPGSHLKRPQGPMMQSPFMPMGGR